MDLCPSQRDTSEIGLPRRGQCWRRCAASNGRLRQWAVPKRRELASRFPGCNSRGAGAFASGSGTARRRQPGQLAHVAGDGVLRELRRGHVPHRRGRLLHRPPDTITCFFEVSTINFIEAPFVLSHTDLRCSYSQTHERLRKSESGEDTIAMVLPSLPQKVEATLDQRIEWAS